MDDDLPGEIQFFCGASFLLDHWIFDGRSEGTLHRGESVAASVKRLAPPSPTLAWLPTHENKVITE